MNVLNTAGSASAAVESVPLLDLQAQYETIREDVESVILEVCESQYFVMGPRVKELEERIAAYSNARHGIGVSSGTDALLVALMALDIGPGDEVITSTYSFFATGGVIARLGARPIFLDIQEDTYNLDPECVRRFLSDHVELRDGRAIRARTGGTVRAIMPVHLFGQVADLAPLRSMATEYGLAVVEDAAQAIGSESSSGERAGSSSDVGCFSFYPSKNLGAFGDGGMCVCNDDELAERLRCLRLHGAKPKYYHSMVGGNFRLDAIQAAVLLVKLRHLDAWTAARQENAARYDELFAGSESSIRTPVTRPGNRHIFNQYVIAVEDRDGLQAFLKSRNIGSEVYYPVPLHLQECFADLGYEEGDCPVAEHAAAHSLALPIFPELSDAQIDFVARSVREFVGA
ncbi:MAG: DegT/DnrJ/EryC1/StrS family aminotransferase [Gemmatimonadota bacterium]